MLERTRQAATLIKNIAHDAARYWQNAFVRGEGTSMHTLARIAVNCHILERGMSLPNPRPGYAANIAEHLSALLLSFLEKNERKDRMELVGAHGTLKAYLRMHAEIGYDLGETRGAVNLALKALQAADIGQSNGAVDHILRESALVQSGPEAQLFLRSRRSVRQYDDRPVDPELVRDAVALGQMAPSVCNRQSGRVHVFLARAKLQKILRHHIGNRGFGETVPAVAIVTADLRTFEGVKERKQAYVDGGLFAMAFLFGLQAVGLAACPLNWSVYIERDRLMRNAASIPSSEIIIMLIAFGHFREEFSVARSCRLRIEDVLTQH